MDTADIREGIYDHLVANVPAVGGRVYDEYTAPADTEKPFVEMAFLPDVPSINTPMGMFMRLEVLVLGEEGNIIGIDPIADTAVAILDKQNVTTPDGRTLRPEYRRDSRAGGWSEYYRASVIRLSFWIPTDFWT